MKENFKYLLSEYRFELGALGLGCLILLGTVAAICLPDTQLAKALPGITLILGGLALIVGAVFLAIFVLGKTAPENRKKIGKGFLLVLITAVSILVSIVFPGLLIIPLGLAFLALYFLPSIIAWKRHHRNLLAIFVLNLLLSPALGIGWVVALVWAFLKQSDPVALQTVR